MDRNNNVMRVTPNMTDDQADIVGVLSFSQLMVERLIKAKENGKHGWNTDIVSLDFLKAKLILAITKNEYIDVANYAMMIYHREKMLQDLIDKHED
jgi:hypothetical protein